MTKPPGLSDLAKRLAEPFAPEDERTFKGRGGRNFTYIEDERVMDRLDENQVQWQLKVEPVDVEKGIVKVALLIYDAPSGQWLVFEDFGYSTRSDGEQLKEAVSDGIRRVGRMAGIGRYLYRRQEDDEPATALRPNRTPPRDLKPEVVAEARPDPATQPLTPAQKRKLMASFDEKGLKDPDLRKVFTMSMVGKSSSNDLTVADFEKLLVALAAYQPMPSSGPGA